MHNSDGEHVLKAHGGTLCLDDPAYSARNGTQLIVYTCKNGANQHWSLP
jgi:Ricin-type beta-trefoil lectin domain-like